jgi:sec-independent protein translocase protein TatC
MSAEDIEASKAPLMDHLIELRSRLIKALLAFGIAFIFCFFFAKQIYNVLVWPFVWIAGPENSKFIYTALLEYFLTQLKLALFGAGFISFPIIAAQIYKFVAPGLYKHERGAFLPYLIATPFFWGRRWSISWCCRCWCASRWACSRPGVRRPRRSSCCPRSASICP